MLYQLFKLQSINAGETDGGIGHQYLGIIGLLNSFRSWEFKHLKRDYNRVAPELAQSAKRNEVSQYWRGSPHLQCNTSYRKIVYSIGCSSCFFLSLLFCLFCLLMYPFPIKKIKNKKKNKNKQERMRWQQLEPEGCHHAIVNVTKTSLVQYRLINLK